MLWIVMLAATLYLACIHRAWVCYDRKTNG